MTSLLSVCRALSNVAEEGLLTEGFFWIPSLGGPTTLAAQKAVCNVQAECWGACHHCAVCWLMDLVDKHRIPVSVYHGHGLLSAQTGACPMRRVAGSHGCCHFRTARPPSAGLTPLHTCRCRCCWSRRNLSARSSSAHRRAMTPASRAASGYSNSCRS